MTSPLSLVFRLWWSRPVGPKREDCNQILSLNFVLFLLLSDQVNMFSAASEFRRKSSASSAQTGSRQQLVKMAAAVSAASAPFRASFRGVCHVSQPSPIESPTSQFLVAHHSVADVSVCSCAGTQISSSMFLSFHANEEQCAFE